MKAQEEHLRRPLYLTLRGRGSQPYTTQCEATLETQTYRTRQICRSFEELRQNGYALQLPYSLKRKHLQALVDLWIEAKLSGGTIENKLTYLRALGEWMKKPNLVGTLADYADRESLQSWDGNGIDAVAKIEEIAITEPYVAIQLKRQAAFGLRVEESFLLRPAEAVRDDGLLSVTRAPRAAAIALYRSDSSLPCSRKPHNMLTRTQGP